MRGPPEAPPLRRLGLVKDRMRLKTCIVLNVCAFTVGDSAPAGSSGGAPTTSGTSTLGVPLPVRALQEAVQVASQILKLLPGTPLYPLALHARSTTCIHELSGLREASSQTV